MGGVRSLERCFRTIDVAPIGGPESLPAIFLLNPVGFQIAP